MIPVPGKGVQYQCLKRNCLKKGRHNAKRRSRKSVRQYYIKSKKGRERNKNAHQSPQGKKREAYEAVTALLGKNKQD